MERSNVKLEFFSKSQVCVLALPVGSPCQKKDTMIRLETIYRFGGQLGSF